MKKKQYFIRLTIIIPIIISGISILSSLGAFRLSEYCLRRGLPENWYLFFWILFIFGFSFACGLLVIRGILKPVDKFISEIGAISAIGKNKENVDDKKDPIERYERFFDQITEVLSAVEARELFPEIVGESRAIRGILKQVKQVSATDSTVLILGESGTGKELIAESIQGNSKRKNKPFIKVNCAAIPEGLLESELLGHEKGAFTGAHSRKIGKFELANGGTIFLDEIGDMGPGTQAKVLRVLEDGRFERVGGTREILSDLRVIAATNKDIEKMVEQGGFREDLYFRLNVFAINIPPLRERKEDIPLLAAHLLSALNVELKLSDDMLQYLMSYSWPGNVREMKNVLERGSVVAENGVVGVEHLPEKIRRGVFEPLLEISGNIILDEEIKRIEKRLILDALKKTGGVQINAAKLLGISQRSLWHRVKKHGIDPKLFKSSII